MTRKNANEDVVVRLEKLLQEYFESALPTTDGLPAVRSCAKSMGYSALLDAVQEQDGNFTRRLPSVASHRRDDGLAPKFIRPDDVDSWGAPKKCQPRNDV